MKQLRKFNFRLLLLLPFLFVTLHVQAQSDYTGESAPTRTYAITNAYIVPAPGDSIVGGTLVIKDGLIMAVGQNVSIPDDAEVIDGTDLYIYAGFIDGMSNTGLNRPEPMDRPDDLFTPDPPNEYAGITPENHVIEQVNIGDNSIDGMRKLGFTITHAVPYGRMLPGSGALIFLSDKEHPDQMILSQDVSLFSQFAGAPGAYPGNVLGIMAKFRDLYRNAEYAKRHTELYAENPKGMQRPSRDRVLEAFFPVIDKQKPIFFDATSSLETRRALRLKNDLNFNLVIGNLEEGWDLADELKNSNTNVFMSIDLPDEPKEGKEDEEKSEEVAQLEERRMEFYNKYLDQYTQMRNAGITYGFSTMGTTSNNVKDNLMTIMEHGLGEDATLAALTVNSAQLLGIQDIAGTLESGKLGNAVVTTAPYFTKDAQVKYVFVDGDKYEYDIKTGARVNEGAANEETDQILLGTWAYEFSTPQGTQTGTFVFDKDSGYYTGTMTSNDGTPDVELTNISFLNNVLSFDFSFDAGGQGIEVVVTGDVDGTVYEAEASVAAFNFVFPIIATKEDPN